LPLLEEEEEVVLLFGDFMVVVGRGMTGVGGSGVSSTVTGGSVILNGHF
jgi:hypothetical protein